MSAAATPHAQPMRMPHFFEQTQAVLFWQYLKAIRPTPDILNAMLNHVHPHKVILIKWACTLKDLNDFIRPILGSESRTKAINVLLKSGLNIDAFANVKLAMLQFKHIQVLWRSTKTSSVGIGKNPSPCGPEMVQLMIWHHGYK